MQTLGLGKRAVKSRAVRGALVPRSWRAVMDWCGASGRQHRPHGTERRKRTRPGPRWRIAAARAALDNGDRIKTSPGRAKERVQANVAAEPAVFRDVTRPAPPLLGFVAHAASRMEHRMGSSSRCISSRAALARASKSSWSTFPRELVGQPRHDFQGCGYVHDRGELRVVGLEPGLRFLQFFGRGSQGTQSSSHVSGQRYAVPRRESSSMAQAATTPEPMPAARVSLGRAPPSSSGRPRTSPLRRQWRPRRQSRGTSDEGGACAILRTHRQCDVSTAGGP